MVELPRNSRVPLDWLQRACAQNPPSKIMNADGSFSGNYSTGPVRLGWTESLFKSQKTDNDKERWSCTCLFPPGVDVSPLVQAANDVAVGGWPEFMTPQGFPWQAAGIESPWHDQMKKAHQYKGYTPGAWFFNVGTYFQPRIVDTAMNDIIDPKRVYPGVWAILAVNPYEYGKIKRQGPTKKGVSFGLQSTVIIGDDEVLGGGGVDPKKAFAGINIQANVDVGKAFGGLMNPGPVSPPVAPNGSGPASLDEMRRLGLI